MVKALSLRPNLLVLLSFLWTMLRAAGASLCCSIAMGRSGSGRWWSKVQGQLNECPVWNRLDVPQFCEKKVKTLKDEDYLLKQVLYEIRKETNSIQELLTLQAMMCCGCEGNGHFTGSWNFSLNGPKMFHVDSNTNWDIEVDSGSNLTRETLERIKEVIFLLNRMSQGECKSWFEEAKLYWEENLEPTALQPTTADAGLLSSAATKLNTSVLLLILPCFLLLFFLRRIINKNRPESMPSIHSQLASIDSSVSRGSSPFFSMDSRHSHSALTEVQVSTHTCEPETKEAAAAAAAAAAADGAAFPLEPCGTELLLESTAPIWTAQRDKVEDAPEMVVRIHLVQPLCLFVILNQTNHPVVGPRFDVLSLYTSHFVFFPFCAFCLGAPWGEFALNGT